MVAFYRNFIADNLTPVGRYPKLYAEENGAAPCGRRAWPTLEEQLARHHKERALNSLIFSRVGALFGGKPM